MELVHFILSYKQQFAYASVLIGAIAAIPYIIGIIGGHRPPYATCVGWLLIGATGFVFHYQAISPDADKWSAFLPALYILIPLVYLLLLIFLKAKWKLDKRDKICLSGIFVCWVIWTASNAIGTTSVVIPLLALVATDTFSSWPMLQDAMKGEESGRKNQVSWSLTALSVLLGTLAVANPWSAEIIYPGYLLVMMGSICFCSLFSHLWLKKKMAKMNRSPAE